MGLDQYGFAVMPHRDNTDFKWVWSVAEATDGKINQIAYWRKHPNLQGWMENLYRDKRAASGDPIDDGDWQSFNCEPLRLTAGDLDALEAAVKGGSLPPTEGFFFGVDSDDEYLDDDLRFVSDARKAMLQDMEIYYYSWW